MNSQRSDQEQRFLFRANAYAIGGYMTRPYSEIIETQASSVLPMVGGGSLAEIEDYKYRDLISFRSAKSKVLGNVGIHDGRRVFNTLSTVTIEDLNIADLVTADRVVARLVSERVEGEEEVPILPIGSYFSNLRIAGQEVRLVDRDTVFKAATPKMLSEHNDPDFLDGMGNTVKLPEMRSPEVGDGSTHLNDFQVMTSLYRKIKSLPPGVERARTPDGDRAYPWGVYIRGFGTVYFGEYMISRFSRRLTMIRVQMGSPEEGEVQLVSTEGNGCTYP